MYVPQSKEEPLRLAAPKEKQLLLFEDSSSSVSVVPFTTYVYRPSFKSKVRFKVWRLKHRVKKKIIEVVGFQVIKRRQRLLAEFRNDRLKARERYAKTE